MGSDIRTVTVDRISGSGNPIAEETLNGSCILVFGAEPGETVEVELEPWGGFFKGTLVDPNEDQKRRAERQWEAFEDKTYVKRRGSKKRKKKIPDWRALRNMGSTVRRPKPAKKKRSKRASKSLQNLGKVLGGVSVETQDKGATKPRRTSYGDMKDSKARKNRSEIAHKYD